MLTWEIFVEIIKIAFLPLVSVLGSIFWQKLKRYDAEIDKLRDSNTIIRSDLTRLEAEMVTREAMDEILKQFESRIDKTIALNIKPLEDLLTRFMSANGTGTRP